MKQFRFVFSPLSLSDIEEAKNYYEEMQAGLGKKFIAQLQLAISALKRNPFFASVRYDDIRCVQLKKFPYLIHYHIDENQFIVRIIAVYSTHQELLG
jgi:toxin ParE1/3/4